MIHTTEGFYGKVSHDILSIYFAEDYANHGYTENKNYHTAIYTMECFSNGCLTYRKLIGRLAKCCNETTSKIHAIVEKYIKSFGQYEYKPSSKIKI